MLDQELAHQGGVPARPAGEEHHPRGLAQPIRRLPELLEVDLAVLEADPPQERVPHRPRLLVDLLEHEVAVAALLRLHRVPGDALGIALDGDARERRDPDARRRHRGDVAVLEEEEVARVGQQRGDVGGDVVLVLAEADHERGPHAGDDEAVGLVPVEQHQGVDAVDLGERRTHGVLERAPVEGLHEVCHHLRVGLGDERVAGPREVRLELEVVLDDAVVDDHDAARAVLVRVRVLLGGAAVGGPPGVPDAPVAVERLRGEARRQVPELARGAAPQDISPAHHRDARRVVAPVLEPAQAVQDDRDRIPPAHVPDDAAHALDPPPPDLPSAGAAEGSADPA